MSHGGGYVKGCQCEGCEAHRARSRERERTLAASRGEQERICKECGGTYTGGGYKYCSDACHGKARRRYKTDKQAGYDASPAGQARLTAKGARDKAWRETNPDQVWAHSLKAAHGMTPGQWQAMLDGQAGLCYLCQRPLPADRSKVAVDHDHQHCRPGRSCGHCRRGLAHPACNSAIGQLLDDPDLLRTVAANLERAKEVTAARLRAAPAQDDLFASSQCGDDSERNHAA